jgi:hypothetical protein
MRALLIVLAAAAACAGADAPEGLGSRDPASAAAQPALAGEVTPASLQADISKCIAKDPSFWSDNDTDGDGQVSQLEIILCLIHHPAWMRAHFPEQFKAIDTDGDRGISIDELLAFAAKVAPGHLDVRQRTRFHSTRDETAKQGFEDPTFRKHFDPVAGFLPRGTMVQEGNFDIFVLR